MSYIGKAVKRVEDKRFITGQGRYTDDIVLPNQTYGVFVRSPYAHAKINSVNTDAAKAMPGVVEIYTGQDVAEVNGVPCGWQVNFKNGDTMKEPKHPLLVADKALHVGDAVAFVIADSPAVAVDAAEAVQVDCEVLPAVTDAKAAAQDGAPNVHADAPSNIAFDWELGNPKDEVEAALASAAHVTELEFVNQRVIPNAIEPRSAIGQYDTATDRYTLYTTSQNPHLTRLLLCAFVLGIPEHKVRVVAPDVGGGFGSKIFHYTEEAMVIWASEKLKRPVKWTSTRTEAFQTDAHGRDHVTHARMGFDANGNVTALQATTYANMGA
ncbi:MAG TPA: carbon monoxide dehydrogenase, partial [Cytophagales bacterium]|nr:carbon monoxide dehydrogenase [Cytophagales bacterium]